MDIGQEKPLNKLGIITMKNNNLDKYTDNYDGRCKIIPCQDFEQMEDRFDNLREEIMEAFCEERIISDWKLKKGIFENGELVNTDEVENYDSEEDYIWYQLVCKIMKKGFFVIYELPVPLNVKKHKDGSYSFTFSWGYYQTYYIHLEDITQLSSVLKNIDKEMKETEYKKELTKQESKTIGGVAE